MNIAHALERAARHHPETVALRGRGAEEGYSYVELDDRVKRLADGLAEHGVGRGDHVAILLRNHTAFIETSLALYRLGAVKVPLNTMLTPGEHNLLVADAGTKVAIVGEEFNDHAAEMEAFPETSFVVGNPDGFSGSARPYGDLLDTDGTVPLTDVDADDRCALMYTSGTTGRPKGVQHTHGTWFTVAMEMKAVLHQRAGEVTLHAAPLTHGSGFLVESTILAGGTNLVQDGFDPQQFLNAVEVHGVHTVFLAPTMVYKLLDHYDGTGRDTSSLKNVYYAGSPMSAARLREGIGKFGDVFIQSYGQMECPMLITVLDQNDHRTALKIDEGRLQSAGREVDAAHVRIVDDVGEDVEPGETGELAVRGPHVTPGYWDLPEKTAEAFHGDWLLTGDIGRVGEEGYVYILDRKKDVIITGGMNVFPREIEEVILEVDSVSNAAVIGVPDDYWGEMVTAVVEPRPNSDVSEDGLREAILEYCEEDLAAYKKPKRVDIVDELPRSSYGKVLKTDLRECYWEDEERRVH